MRSKMKEYIHKVFPVWSHTYDKFDICRIALLQFATDRNLSCTSSMRSPSENAWVCETKITITKVSYIDTCCLFIVCIKCKDICVERQERKEQKV